MLDVEAALARRCAAEGLIPLAQRQAIAAACDAERFDVADARASRPPTHATPVVGLVAGAAGRGRRAGAPRCAPRRHQPGHHRHRADADRRAGRWRRCSAMPAPLPTLPPRLAHDPPRHPDGRTDAAAAGAADHVRAARGRLAGRARRSARPPVRMSRDASWRFRWAARSGRGSRRSPPGSRPS